MSDFDELKALANHAAVAGGLAWLHADAGNKIASDMFAAIYREIEAHGGEAWRHINGSCFEKGCKICVDDFRDMVRKAQNEMVRKHRMKMGARS